MTPLAALLPCPLLACLAVLAAPSPRALTRIAAALALIQAGIAIIACAPFLGAPDQAAIIAHGFRLDGTSAFFVLLSTLVMTAALVHGVAFFDGEATGEHPPTKRDLAILHGSAALFLISMYGVVAADDLGALWISLEASTLLSAPLVYYHRTRTSLEATWKYLIVCSVGIAFAFFGTALLYAASQRLPALGGQGTLSIAVLTAHARELPVPTLRLAFVFMLLGYGTKAGLFPLHSWLPDAHSEAPAPMSAVLSGALLNCALVALWRLSRMLDAAGQETFVHATLLPLGALTALAASLFLLRQQDLKRLWAYSSMENVGLMATAIAIGSGSGFLLQALNHSVAKVALFLLAGNTLQEHGTKRMRRIHGLLGSEPLQACLVMAAAFAVVGSPPFGSFLAEWQILMGAADRGMAVVAITIMAALALAFVAVSVRLGGMLLGPPPTTSTGVTADRPVTFAAVPLLLVLVALLLGVALPPGVVAMAQGGLR